MLNPLLRKEGKLKVAKLLLMKVSTPCCHLLFVLHVRRNQVARDKNLSAQNLTDKMEG